MYSVYNSTGKKIETGFRTELEAEWWIDQNFLENCTIKEDR